MGVGKFVIIENGQQVGLRSVPVSRRHEVGHKAFIVAFDEAINEIGHTPDAGIMSGQFRRSWLAVQGRKEEFVCRWGPIWRQVSAYAEAHRKIGEQFIVFVLLFFCSVVCLTASMGRLAI